MQNQMTQHNTAGKHTDDSIAQYLTFILNDETYGINILNIKEIIEYGHITRVPMTPDFIAGVINLRGSVVPVIDLAQRFSEQASKRTSRSSILILEVEDEDQAMEIGVTVDVVNEVLDILSSDIEPPPLFGTKIRTDFINGMGKMNGQLLVLLHIDNILSITELSTVENS